MEFPSSLFFEGERLINHVIASGGVMNKDICELQCYMEHNCVSINFEVRPRSGAHNCDLNNSTDKEHEKDLVKAANYVYHGTNVSCKTSSISATCIYFVNDYHLFRMKISITTYRKLQLLFVFEYRIKQRLNKETQPTKSNDHFAQVLVKATFDCVKFSPQKD